MICSASMFQTPKRPRRSMTGTHNSEEESVMISSSYPRPGGSRRGPRRLGIGFVISLMLPYNLLVLFHTLAMCNAFTTNHCSYWSCHQRFLQTSVVPSISSMSQPSLVFFSAPRKCLVPTASADLTHLLSAYRDGSDMGGGGGGGGGVGGSDRKYSNFGSSSSDDDNDMNEEEDTKSLTSPESNDDPVSSSACSGDTTQPPPHTPANETTDKKPRGKKVHRKRGLTIPLIGPIPRALPLFLGSEMTLDPPTPLQWKALEECVVVHQNYVRKQLTLETNKAGDKNNSNEDADGTAINAAPLVAIIDDVSGTTPVRPPNFKHGDAPGRYATLAAVVGIRNKRTQSSKKSLLSMDDESSFMESIMRIRSRDGGAGDDDMIIPSSSTVRLVAVGRAVLKDFFYKVPTELSGDEMKDEDEDDDEDDDFEEWDEDEDKTPIVMAEFDLLTDNGLFSSVSPTDIGVKGARSAQSSPVHALAELSRIANRVTWMHDDRRRLVAGLTAAKARLHLANLERKRSKQKEEEIEHLEDYDGLGLLGGGNSYSESEDEAVEGGMTIDEFLSTFKGSERGSEENDISQSHPSATEKLAKMENYGVNYYSAFSSIPDLTNAALKIFEPYYSTEHREREEHELEVRSFVAFRALEGFASAEDMAWALQCTCTAERLTRAYEIMLRHRVLLEKLAEEVSDELRDCGEECTDLW